MASNELFPDLEGDSENQGKRTKRKGKKVVFKPDHRQEQYLLPPSLDEFVPPDHIARFVDAIVDHLDLTKLLYRYKGGGASAFHPATLLKIWLFGWLRKIYTSRPLAEACKRDVEFMWISGVQQPSFMTLSAFRKNLGEDIKTIFREVVMQAIRAGVIDGTEIYIDHTKMEANANRFRIIWRKRVERYLEKVDLELEKLFELIDRLNEEEDKNSSEENAAEVTDITPEMIDALASRINQQLKENQKDREQAKEEKSGLKRGKKYLIQKEKYDSKLKELGDKNSMAMSDSEAPAMMMKDKLSIKPGYNVGIAVQNGITTGFDVSNNGNDSVSFKKMLTESQSNTNEKPKRVCADAGYGNNENYQYLEANRIKSYVKYPGWEKDLKGKRSLYAAESFHYHKETDCWMCPNNRVLKFSRILKRENKRTGYVDVSREYQASPEDCSGCPHKESCTKAQARSIRVNKELRRHRKQAVENLNSPMGKRMRSLRGVEVETIFGIQKEAFGFRRFHLRGIEGATIETGLFLTAHNLRRLHQVFIRFMEYGVVPVLKVASS